MAELRSPADSRGSSNATVHCIQAPVAEGMAAIPDLCPPLVRRRIVHRALRHRRQWPACAANASLSSQRRGPGPRRRSGHGPLIHHGSALPSADDSRSVGPFRGILPAAFWQKGYAPAEIARESESRQRGSTCHYYGMEVQVVEKIARNSQRQLRTINNASSKRMTVTTTAPVR